MNILKANKLFLSKNYYGLTNLQLMEDSSHIIKNIGYKRGCLKRGGLDKPRISTIILKDFRDGKLGKVSFEYPNF